MIETVSNVSLLHDKYRVIISCVICLETRFMKTLYA